MSGKDALGSTAAGAKRCVRLEATLPFRAVLNVDRLIQQEASARDQSRNISRLPRTRIAALMERMPSPDDTAAAKGVINVMSRHV